MGAAAGRDDVRLEKRRLLPRGRRQPAGRWPLSPRFWSPATWLNKDISWSPAPSPMPTGRCISGTWWSTHRPTSGYAFSVCVAIAAFTSAPAMRTAPLTCSAPRPPVLRPKTSYPRLPRTIEGPSSAFASAWTTTRLPTIFRWGVENELVPPGVYQALQAVRGLQQGRTEARESEPVAPVPPAHIEAVRPFVSRQVWALIQLQLATAARIS